MRRNMIRDYRS